MSQQPAVIGKSRSEEALRSFSRAVWSALAARPVLVPFLVALVVRVVAAVAITETRGYLFPDEPAYVELGRLVANGQLTPAFMISGQTGESLFREAAAFMWPLTVLFKVFGAHPLVAALWAAVFGAVTAALTALLAARILPRPWAAGAGLVVALLPSQVLWSSVVLRESMVWAALCAAALGVSLFARARGWAALGGATLLVGASLLTLAYLRNWVFLPGAWAAALAVWLFRPERPVVARGACLSLCLLLPLGMGLGPAGYTYVHKNNDLAYERDMLSLGAKSAFVHPKLVPVQTSTSNPTPPATSPSTGTVSRVTEPASVARASPSTRPGTVTTGKARSATSSGGGSSPNTPTATTAPPATGASTSAAPATAAPATAVPTTVVPTTAGSTTTSPTTLVTVPKFLGLPEEDLVLGHSGVTSDIRALPGGLAAFLLRPFPWQHGGGLSYDFAAVEELLYYPLYVLALVGLVAYWRRRDVLAFPVLVAVFISGIAAEAEGNLGSAFRHRDQLFWAVALLAALGSYHLYSGWQRRREQAATVAADETPRPGDETAVLSLHRGVQGR